MNSSVNALAVYNGELIAGGNLLTAGNQVSAFWARWGPDCARGDMTCDGAVNISDVTDFVAALVNPMSLTTCTAYTANVNGDVNLDGTPRIDGQDIQLFVASLTP